MDSKRILVIGELNVDIILSGMTDFPTLGKEILADDLHIVMGSSSAICAAGMARLGAAVDFVGKVGTDTYGDFAIEQLRLLGVNIDRVIRDDALHTGVTISLTYPKDRAMITYLGSISRLSVEDMDTSILQDYDHLHVSAYFLQQALRPGLPELFSQARRAGLTTSLDTGHDPDEDWARDDLQKLLRNVDIFMPNQEEACAIAQANDAQAALRELSKYARLVVVKCGPSGAISLHDGQIVRGTAFGVKTVDTTGAGDSFDAGLIYARIVLDLPLEETLRFANACGSLSTTDYGGTAAQPTLEQVQTLLRTQQ